MVESNKSEFWVVWQPGSGEPRVRHNLESPAREEAKRLAREEADKRQREAEAAAKAAAVPAPVYKAVERILDEHSAWIARPNDRITRAVSLAVIIATQSLMMGEDRALLEIYEALVCEYDVGSAIQAIAKLKETTQWRDIKDAPRDGRPIIIAWLYNSEWLFSTVRWDADFGIWEDDSGLEYEEFLLWAPVPLPSSPEGVE